jgi:hypothetical protein
LGWDGKDDDNVFIVEDTKSTRTITKNEKAGNTTDASKVKIELMTNLTELQESLNVLGRVINNGGFREESSVVTPDRQITVGVTGPLVTEGVATGVLPFVPGKNNTSIHGHLTGETAKSRWVPDKLGPEDPNTFKDFQLNIVVGKFLPEEGDKTQNRKEGAVFYDRNSNEIGRMYSDAIYKILRRER